jgi:biopolymer transport protein ExbD
MRTQRYLDDGGGQFNMTPMIDIVFLLVIFFMIVCQFIVAENFQVSVPDDISSGQRSIEQDEKTTTVTVMLADGGGVSYAVGSEIVASSGGEQISDSIAAAINRQLTNLPEERRVVGLRVDKGVVFKDSQYAIAGISESSATDIKLSVIRLAVSD